MRLVLAIMIAGIAIMMMQEVTVRRQMI